MMTTIFPDFRRRIDDEPTQDWTVEEVMQWYLLQSHDATDRKHDELIEALNRQLEDGKTEIWRCHEQAMSVGQSDPALDENAAPNVKPNETESKEVPRSFVVKKVNVHITEGPHAGKAYQLQPKPRAPCWVGRSAGKKFRDRGISLPDDGEVSTTHGKFDIVAGKAYFTDTGSTNGSLHEGVELEDNVPLELKDGMILKLGATCMKITLES